MSSTPRIPVRVDIEQGVSGARNIQTLLKEIKDLRAAGQRPIRDPTREMRRGAERTAAVVGRLRNQLVAAFSAGVVTRGVRDAVRAFAQLEQTLRGLEGVATVTGAGVREAFDVAREIEQASEGLISFQQASEALRNLLQGGATLDEARRTILALADASAVARSSQLSLGEAVVEGTEALRLGSSERLDNAGITKNLSVLEDEYAESLGKTRQELSEYEVQQARILGVQREAAIFAGQLQTATEAQSATFARAANEARRLAQTLGEVLLPAVASITEAFVNAGKFITTNFVRPLIAATQELFIRIGDAVRTGSFELSDAAKASIAEVQDALLSAQSNLERGIRRTAAAASEAQRETFIGGISQAPTDRRGEEAAARRAKSAAERRAREAERQRQRELRAAQRAAEETRRIDEALARARFQLAELTGTDTAATRRQAIALQFDDLRRDLEARSDEAGLALIENLINVQAAEAEFTQLEAVLSRRLADIREQQSVITSQQAAGLLTESQAREQIVALQRESADVIRETIPLLEEQAAALGPEAAADVARWRAELERASIVVNQTALRFKGEFTDAVTDFFVAIGEGSKSAGEAFRDFAQTVLRSIQRILAEQFAQKLVGNITKAFGNQGGGGGGGGIFGGGGLFGGGGGRGSPFSFLSGILSRFLKFSEGGAVSGPGTSTSDSIPAMLSTGEYVVNARAVSALGAGLLDGINRIGRGGLGPAPLRFASGGQVPAAASTPAAAPGLRVVNVLDPQLAGDYLESSAGERTVLNIIERNRGTVRQSIS